MKRTCNGCRALLIADERVYCSLGKPQVSVMRNQAIVAARPAGECPKPRSTRELVRLLIERQKTASESEGLGEEKRGR